MALINLRNAAAKAIDKVTGPNATSSSSSYLNQGLGRLANAVRDNSNVPVLKSDGARFSGPKDPSPLNPANWTGSKPQVLPNQASGSSYSNALAYRQNQAQRDTIGRGWDDAGSVQSSSGGALKDFGKNIGSKLAQARDKYLTARQGHLDLQNQQIEGNRQLIQKNQTTDLRGLGEQMRKSIFNTNLNLGAAAGSSASMAAGKALTDSAGKDRYKILTGYGDQISEQNQNSKNSLDSYNLDREKIYSWEDQQKQALTDQFNNEMKIYKRLKEKAPDWKKADIEEQGNSRLQEYLQGMAGVGANARALRDQLTGTIQGLDNEIMDLRKQGIGIDTPAALDTPEFSDQLGADALEGQDTYTDSFYNPTTFKKRQGYDAFGNPLTFDYSE